MSDYECVPDWARHLLRTQHILLEGIRKIMALFEIDDSVVASWAAALEQLDNEFKALLATTPQPLPQANIDAVNAQITALQGLVPSTPAPEPVPAPVPEPVPTDVTPPADVTPEPAPTPVDVAPAPEPAPAADVPQATVSVDGVDQGPGTPATTDAPPAEAAPADVPPAPVDAPTDSGTPPATSPDVPTA